MSVLTSDDDVEKTIEKLNKVLEIPVCVCEDGFDHIKSLLIHIKNKATISVDFKDGHVNCIANNKDIDDLYSYRLYLLKKRNYGPITLCNSILSEILNKPDTKIAEDIITTCFHRNNPGFIDSIKADPVAFTKYGSEQHSLDCVIRQYAKSLIG